MRSDSFTHKLGGMIDLPLVVPSLSSKGFRYFKDQDSGKIKSETSVVLELLGNFLNESYLISAYDLFHKLYINPEKHLTETALILVDSGGYELSPEFDSSEPKITPVLDWKFTNENYIEVLESLYATHKDKPLLIANFDWATRGQGLLDQIRAARRLFQGFPNWSSNFILKPNAEAKSIVHVKDVVPVADELRGFDVIGVTEKELGRGLKERLRRLAKLRLALWDYNVNAPIHVWGGLDPMVTPLYFFAGADIFDGVSWLRYAYHDGLAVSMDSGPILRKDITISYDHNVALTRMQNLSQLQGLANNLRIFASGTEPNFEAFGSRKESLKSAYQVMSSMIPRFEGLR